MEDYYEYLDSNGVTTLYKLIKDDTVALIDSYSVTINGITTTLDTHINDSDIHTPIADIENMVDTKVSGLVNSAPETLDTLKELSDALGNDPNFATTVANQIGNKANKDSVYTKEETDTLLEGKANSEHNHVVSDITDFPTIPTKTSELINDSGFLTSSSGLITSVSWSDITNKPNFSTVATSGSYTDLSNTPTIPTKVSQLENDMGFGTGGDTSDCVHKTGDETISGAKIFLNDIFRKNTSVDLTVTPTGYTNTNIIFADKNDKTLAHIEYVQRPSGVNDVGIFARDKNGNAHGIHINTNNEVIPLMSSSESYSLGSATYKWKKIYSDDVVHTTGDEYIHGNKIFSNTIHRFADLTTSGGAQVYRFDDTNANACGHIYNNVHWHNNAVYNRHGSYNAKSGKCLELDLITNGFGRGTAYISGTVTDLGNLTDATPSIDERALATMGWVNNPATSTNVVHRSGDETINGVKSFNNMIKATNGTVQVGADTGYSVTFNYNGSIVSKQPSGTYNIFLPKFDGELLGTTFVKGTNSWYRKHSDGFIEQGGIGNASIMESNNQVTLPTPFSNTNYVVTGSSNFRADIVFGVSSKTATYFYCGLSQPGITWVTGTFSWYACGY